MCHSIDTFAMNSPLNLFLFFCFSFLAYRNLYFSFFIYSTVCDDRCAFKFNIKCIYLYEARTSNSRETKKNTKKTHTHAHWTESNEFCCCCFCSFKTVDSIFSRETRKNVRGVVNTARVEKKNYNKWSTLC